jgi:hypothetical protein
MSERKFKFISPGVFTSEIDNSQLPKIPDPIGPVIIGRTRKGPAFRPTTVNSFEEFIQIFGDPIAGGKGGDVWRDGNELAPTYASFAAQAWLKNSNAVTVVRLLGQQHPDVSDGAANAGAAGYEFDGIADNNTSQGAYGLFVWPSGSAASNGYTVSGTLAAVFYMNEGRVILSGTNVRGAMTASGCQMFKSDANGEFVAQIHGLGTESVHSPSERVTFNFDPSSDRFIRKVFNTNPTLVNDNISTATLADGSARVNYVLGETFERKVLKGSPFRELHVDSSPFTGDVMLAAIMPMQNPAAPAQEHGDFKFSATKATTGWFISQDLTDSSGSYAAENQQRLFRLEARDVGEEIQRTVKLSIQNVKASTTNADPYGTFDVVVRDIRDTDNRQRVLERFAGCNLNPASPNYIANRIGDQHEVYDSAEKRNRRYGEYANRSDYIRVVMNGDVERAATDSRLLPFGFFGPTKYRDVDIVSGSTSLHSYGKGQGGAAGGGSVHSLIDGGGDGFGDLMNFGLVGIVPAAVKTQLLDMGKGNMTASIRFPELPLVLSSSYGSPNSKEVTHFGVYTGQTIANNRYNPELTDIVRTLSVNFKDYTAEASLDLAQVNPDTATTPDVPVRQVDTSTATTSARQHSFVFSLDNVGPVPGKASEAKHYYGLRKAGFSYTAGAVHSAAGGAREASFTTGSYMGVLDAGWRNFTTLLHGGHDGLNITELEPFNNTRIGTDETTGYALHSVVRALDLVRDPEDVEGNLLAVPGITSTIVTDKMLEVAEDRGDMLAVIDLGGVFSPSTENTSNYQTRAGTTVKSAVDTLTNREINTSYGAAYYPWVRARDTLTGKLLWLPPSIPALGAMSFTDRVGAPWFAPAGLARGGLSDGAGGLPIIDVTKKLTSKDRDDLYAAGVNPIAKFPAEGIVIFGQKTLQTTPSALDRVNVRRLMIFIKREISRVAARIVFAQNTRETWNRFLGEAEPILRNVKAQFGLEDFRLILDESTTTPDLIDRNIIYAKVLLKPTRTAEFFAIDFSIARSGASFAD